MINLSNHLILLLVCYPSSDIMQGFEQKAHEVGAQTCWSLLWVFKDKGGFFSPADIHDSMSVA